jgi:diaminohydroxyphosphoribosylaminopyrimidine deaminase / 5-amino-6-(5-phosphoribosylamino)uracil reductase
VFSEGGPSCAEALVASARPLGEPGVPAIGPRLKAALGERFRRVAAEQLGPDRLELFERA